MEFEFNTSTVDGVPVFLRFRPYGDAPGRISRRNVNNIEAQFWDYLEWGLVSPVNWPEDSDRPGHAVLDDIPQRAIMACYNAWQTSDEGS
jgi:hypothetical protein